MRWGLFLVWALWAQLSLAKDLQFLDLYRNESPKRFTDTLGNLSPGDTLTFSDGKAFKLGKRLGVGWMTYVYEIEGQPGRVLRIPRRKSVSNFINQTIFGAKKLREADVPIVKVFQAKANEYAVVEKIEPYRGKVFTFAHFIAGPAIRTAEQIEMKERLFDFARKTKDFSQIGDFRPDQLAWDPQTHQWVLMDWTMKHELADLAVKSNENIFGKHLQFFIAPKVIGNMAIHAPRPAWVQKLGREVDKVVSEARYGPSPPTVLEKGWQGCRQAIASAVRVFFSK